MINIANKQRQNITADITQLSDLDSFAKQMAETIPEGSWVYLIGDLGYGKTTFTKSFIKYKGCNELVTSPTYAIMQDYQTSTGTVIHCDLYRLSDPEELYEIGLLEMVTDKKAISLIEWPSKGAGVLPKADVIIELFLSKESRSATVYFSARTIVAH